MHFADAEGDQKFFHADPELRVKRSEPGPFLFLPMAEPAAWPALVEELTKALVAQKLSECLSQLCAVHHRCAPCSG